MSTKRGEHQFFWTFIPAIVSLLEALTFLSYSDDAFNEKYADKKSLVSKSGATGDLVNLSMLYEKKHITQEEYEEKKQILLKKIG